ncbi:MAG: sigma-54-dependent Fis family transcriptional regulator [Sandaracinaceae bacterium]|nr:sigma-54-dependent Fis family transcriptional regulator [Sandaracinaceae bacterium]MBP7680816.1 sigma-54-dependent Fis family transcriptional regulator [Deltaproteobacteria bacterium]
MTTTRRNAWTTASQQSVNVRDSDADPTPGLVLVYSRLHAQLVPVAPLRTSPFSVGREDSNALCIPEAAVSRHHARLEQRGQRWWIVDQNSTNGVTLNGVRVSEAPLASHDVLRIGDSVYRFATDGATRYVAYPPSAQVVAGARPFTHDRSGPLIGGYQIDQLLDRVQRVAPTGLAVIITGESGTGKELVARELHRRSGRTGHFQAINCAALSPTLIESELFGHRKGAFTGATHDKPGLLRAADGGTLFLDEIGDMPLEAQAKLLRVLQEKEVLPIGASRPVALDVRVACATHRDLEDLVAGGSFRGDLLARLREFEIELPPLRHRREDVLPLLRHFLAAAGRPVSDPSFSYMLALAHYDWPYNVREMESAVRLSVALAAGMELDLRHLPKPVQAALDEHGQPARAPQHDARGHHPARETARGGDAPDEVQLRLALAEHRGNVAAVGRVFGKERMQVHRWMRRYGINAEDYRA